MNEILDLARVTALALADSVNPCAIAVLAIVLITLITQDPTKRKKVLLGGFSFIFAVYIGYLAYAIFLVGIFNILQSSLSSTYLLISKIFYNALAVFAMIIGALQVKDYFHYKAGSFATEMPIFMRPKMKKWVKKITSPSSAFLIGIFVTLFLLPCTIGPLVIVSGLLAEIGIISAIPWLLYYNLLFVIPMVIIVLIIYFGFAKVEDVAGWKEKNIRTLHLIAGILMFLVGLSLLMGWL